MGELRGAMSVMEPNVISDTTDTVEAKRVRTAPEWTSSKDCPCSSREAVAAAVVGSKVYLFGGLNHDKGYLADVHMYHTGNNEWKAPSIEGAAPRARDKHTAVPLGDKLVVFGGFGMVPQPEDDKDDAAEGMGALFFSWHNDTHLLHTAGETCRWELLNTTGTLTGPSAPSARAALSAVGMGDTELVIFGGKAKAGRMNDVWKFDINSCVWAEIDCTSAPSGRSFQSSCAFEGKVYVFGGVNRASKHLNDVHVLDLESRNWREVECVSAPTERGNVGSALVGSKMHIFCGSAGLDTATNMCSDFFKDMSCLDLSRC